MKLYYVSGIRHHAVVLAMNKAEAIEKAITAGDNKSQDKYVLCGCVEKWESPEAEELRLPEGVSLESKVK